MTDTNTAAALSAEADLYERAKVFAKLIREITVAARAGLPDPAANPRLRAGVLAALRGETTLEEVNRVI